MRRRNLLIQSDIPKVSEFHRLFLGPSKVRRQEAITGTCISTAVLHLQIQQRPFKIALQFVSRQDFERTAHTAHTISLHK